MQLVAEGSDPVQSYARTILLSNNLISYSEPIILPDETKSVYAGKQHKTTKFSNSGILKIFPNPSSQYLIIEYNQDGTEKTSEKITLTINALDGKTIEELILLKSKDQMLIDCSYLKPGTYLCKLTNGRRIIGTGKFTVVR